MEQEPFDDLLDVASRQWFVLRFLPGGLNKFGCCGDGDADADGDRYGDCDGDGNGDGDGDGGDGGADGDDGDGGDAECMP